MKNTHHHLPPSPRPVSRRRFLTTAAASAAVAPFLSMVRGFSADTAATAVPDLCYATAKSVVQPSDLRWLGALRVPRELSDVGSNPSGTLSGRVVDGQTRLFMQASQPDGAKLVEFADPGHYGQSVASAPVGPTVRYWGDIYGGRRLKADGAPMTARFDTQLFWDDLTESIYWSYIDSYAVTQENHPVFGCTALKPDGSSVAYGPWQSDVGPHKAMRTLLRIPQTFADQYLDGHSFAVGSIGTESGNSGSSWGPALFGLMKDPGPGLPDFRSSGVIKTRALVGYDFENRCRRDTNYVAHGSPDLPGGYWTQMDGYNGTACWIDLPDKHGLMYFQRRATGHIWYGVGENCGHGLSDIMQTTGPHSTSSTPFGYIYDPEDLGAVASGSRASHSIDPTAFDMSGEGLWRDHHADSHGCWFEPSSRRLYVSTVSMEQIGCCFHYPIVNVYEVA